MWPVERPDLDAGETFATCISRVQDKTVRRHLAAIRPNIEAAANDYAKKAKNGKLHLIQQMETIDGVSGQELVKTYDSRMAKKGRPGRAFTTGSSSCPTATAALFVTTEMSQRWIIFCLNNVTRFSP